MALVDDIDTSAIPLPAGLDQTSIDAAVSWACSAVESYCRRHFSFVAGDVVVVNPLPNATAQLPDPPVVTVTKVEAWLPTPAGDAMAWREITNYDYTSDGIIYDTTGQPGVTWTGQATWPLLPEKLRVTYDHGFRDIPQPIVDAISQAVGIQLANPYNLRSEQVDDIRVSYGAPNGAAGQLDSNLLDTYRIYGAI